jgi:hypothetical protein
VRISLDIVLSPFSGLHNPYAIVGIERSRAGIADSR